MYGIIIRMELYRFKYIQRETDWFVPMKDTNFIIILNFDIIKYREAIQIFDDVV